MSKTIRETVSACTVADHAAWLAHRTDAELQERADKLEAMGRATAAKLAQGDRGEVRGSHVHRGNHVPTYTNEAALNSQRHAWAVTKAVIAYRKAQASAR